MGKEIKPMAPLLHPIKMRTIRAFATDNRSALGDLVRKEWSTAITIKRESAPFKKLVKDGALNHKGGGIVRLNPRWRRLFVSVQDEKRKEGIRSLMGHEKPRTRERKNPYRMPI